MYKALVLGCGNIGAMYDFNNENVLTHAKALHLHPEFSLTVFDSDTTRAGEVAAKYNCDALTRIDTDVLSLFDCVSICTPTHTHYEYLLKTFKANSRLVICEKPVSNDERELNEIENVYKGSDVRILVNYFRRFQPDYRDLQMFLTDLAKNESLTNVSIRYQRGFINNCSHAFDLIEFLIGSELKLTDVKTHNLSTDHFPTDPTLSLQSMWGQVNVNVLGLSDVKFAHFEIDLYFKYYKICIKESGQKIEVYKADQSDQYLQPLQIQEQLIRKDCLKNYMVPVIDHAAQILKGDKKEDNFLSSVRLNHRMLTYTRN